MTAAFDPANSIRQRIGPPTPRAEDNDDILVDLHRLFPSGSDWDLFNGSPNNYLTLGVPLYRAALEGNWKAANEILQKHPNLVRAKIGKSKDTALHIAAAARREYFIKELVKLMEKEDLALQNAEANTALCFAAASGNVNIAIAMVEKNGTLPLIRGSKGMTPLYMATLWGDTKMARYLADVTNFAQLTPSELFHLRRTSIDSDLYDLALEILAKYPDLALSKYDDDNTALHSLAQKRLQSNSVQASLWAKCCNYLGCWSSNMMTRDQALELVNKLWNGLIIKKNYNSISRMLSGSPSQLLFKAAEVGNIEFLKILIGTYPDLIWKVNEDKVSIFHVAVAKRQAEVFNLIYEIGAIKDLLATYVDKKHNNMLHFAAMKPPPNSLDNISGAALQMQRELLWYKEVERVLPLQFRKSKNKKKQTPLSLFTESHKELRENGEEWMRTTANSCSVVAGLIATVTFTAAFTVPGGNDQVKGTPIFQRNPVFVVLQLQMQSLCSHLAWPYSCFWASSLHGMGKMTF